MQLTSLTLGALALFQGAAANRLHDRRAIILAQRASNSSAIILTPIRSPTLTAVATTPPAPPKSDPTTSLFSSRKEQSSPTQKLKDDPSSTSILLIDTTIPSTPLSVTQPTISVPLAESPKPPSPPSDPNPPASPPKSAPASDVTPSVSIPDISLNMPCTATITSTQGQNFMPFVGSCSQTVTVVTTLVAAGGNDGPGGLGGGFNPGKPTEISPPVNTAGGNDGSGGVDGGSNPGKPTETSPPVNTAHSIQTPSSPGSVATSTPVKAPNGGNGGPDGPNPPQNDAPASSSHAGPTNESQPINTPPVTQSSQAVSLPPTPSSSPTETHPPAHSSPSAVGPPTHSSEPTATDPTKQPSKSGSAPGPTATKPSASVPSSVNDNGPSDTPGSSSPSPTTGPTTTLPPAPILLGAQTILADSNSNLIIGSQTLTPGGEITVSGQRISVHPDGAVYINAAKPTGTPQVVVIDGKTVTANSNGGFIISGQTLYPGHGITVGGEVITLPSAAATGSINTYPILKIGSSIYTENSDSAFIVGTQTLKPGGVITVSDQTVSLAPTGNVVVFNNKITTTAMPTTFATMPPQSPISNVVIAGETLTAGGRVTVGGDILSLEPSGTGITVVGTVTLGGGMSTTTAVVKAGKKNAGERLGGRVSFVIVSQGFVAALAVLAFRYHGD